MAAPDPVITIDLFVPEREALIALTPGVFWLMWLLSPSALGGGSGGSGGALWRPEPNVERGARPNKRELRAADSWANTDPKGASLLATSATF